MPRIFARSSKTGASVKPSSSDRSRWRWEMRLTGYGYGEALRPLSKTGMTFADNRVEYRYRVTPPLTGLGKTRSTPPSGANVGERVALTEWYVNDARGVEHGFTLNSPPPGAREGSSSRAISASARTPLPAVGGEAQARDREFLHLTLDVSGNLQGRMIEEGASIQFVTADGTPVLGYRDLHAYDSTGRALPARLSLKGERLSVMVDDRTALYPVTIDPPIFSKTRLTVSDGAASDQFGSSVSVDGDTVVVGAPIGIPNSVRISAAYVFFRSGPFWSQQAKLTASDGAASDFFGSSVSVDGDTVAVGAFFDDDAGSAYVFVRRGTSWSQQAKLTASDGAAYDYFGSSVSVDGDMVVVGAPRDATAAGYDAGSAHVFVRSGRASWSHQIKLTASDGAVYDHFGASVSVDGNIIVVGAPESVFNKPGSAYVYIRNGSLYVLGAKLNALDDFEAAAFGHSVAVSRTRLGTLHVVVGKPLDNEEAGSAYVFGFGELPYITAAVDDVAMLYREGLLNPAQADALIANLEAAIEALDRNDVGAAFDQLRAFINQVTSYVNARILAPAQGRTLIDQATDIIGRIDR